MSSKFPQTADDLMQWGKVLDAERPNGLGENLMNYAHAWQDELSAMTAERDQWKAIAEDWARAADKAMQPAAFYKEYDEGTMRAMQALMTRSQEKCAELRFALRYIAEQKDVTHIKAMATTTLLRLGE